MKRILVFLFFLLLMQHVSAQEPPHLEPVTITEMVPVKIDLTRTIDSRNAETLKGRSAI